MYWILTIYIYDSNLARVASGGSYAPFTHEYINPRKKVNNYNKTTFSDKNLSFLDNGCAMWEAI